MIKPKYYIIILISLLLFGCASTGPVFEKVNIENDSKSIIYIYRPDTVCLMSAKQQFLIDDNLITLKNNEYAWVSVNPGSHQIISGEFKNLKVPALSTEITTELGESYYVKYDISCDSKLLFDNPSFKFHLAEVDDKTALDELSKSHLSVIPIKKR